MKKTLALTGMIMLMCSAMPALANDDMDMMKMMNEKHMKEADTNNDGMISMAESQACAKKMFMKADVNGDKMVSKQEMNDAMMKDMEMSKDGMMNDDKMMMKKH